MNNIYKILIAMITFTVFHSVMAGDLTYFPQSSVNCTIAVANQPVCDIDKTYMAFNNTDLPSALGKYHFEFEGAVAEYDSDIQNWNISWSYTNLTHKKDFLDYVAFNILPDLNAPGNLWVKEPSSSSYTIYSCGRSFSTPLAAPATPSQCPYTHTPFVNSNSLNTAVLNVSTGTNQIIINNQTNKAVVVHADDYNNSTMAFTTFVPANTSNFVAATYQNADPKNFNLMFDTELVADGKTVENRNSDNTVIFTATITPNNERFTYQNYILPLFTTTGQQQILVQPEISKQTFFPIDENGNIYIDVKYSSGLTTVSKKSNHVTIARSVS